MDEAAQEVPAGFSPFAVTPSAAAKDQPPRYGMTEGEFEDLLNLAVIQPPNNPRPRTSGNTESIS